MAHATLYCYPRNSERFKFQEPADRSFSANHAVRVHDAICLKNNSDKILKIDLKYAYKLKMRISTCSGIRDIGNKKTDKCMFIYCLCESRNRALV
jgi:hypothetical protein